MYTGTSGACVCNPYDISLNLPLLCQQSTSTNINPINSSSEPTADSTTIMMMFLVLADVDDFSRSAAAVLVLATWVVIGCVLVEAVTVVWEAVVAATVVVTMERENKTLF